MDRFKAKSIFYVIRIEYTLHSSMDRFKVIDKQQLVTADSALHSSMDRFKVVIQYLFAQSSEHFTFQYG